MLRDGCSIEIQAPEEASGSTGPTINWSVTTTAFAEVTLDRTPLRDEPGCRDHGGYGGLSWRGSKALEQVQFSDSEGRKDMESHRQLAPWVNATGTLDGKPAGIAIMALKTPFGALSSWFLVANPKIPFWYLNPAILQPKPIKLKADTSFTHRYRVIPDDGTWSPE